MFVSYYLIFIKNGDCHEKVICSCDIGNAEPCRDERAVGGM